MSIEEKKRHDEGFKRHVEVGVLPSAHADKRARSSYKATTNGA